MRAGALLVLVVLLAGCSAPPAPEERALRMLALDGRWPFDPAVGAALLAEGGAAPVGALVLGEAMTTRVLDHVGLDADAARTLGVTPPAAGEAVVARSTGLAVGETLALRSLAWPTPYVATYFEMERTPRCEDRDAKLCLLPELEQGTARLRLRVDEGARDAAFLPDLVELGATGRPAYWNGTFESPSGARTPFTAYALVEGALVPAELDAAMEAGEWTVSFRLEANGELAAAGAAGIVRVREPGYLWFDDRLQAVADPAAQARAVIANATPTRAEVRVVRVDDALPAGADIMLALDDARTLSGARGVTALLADLTPSQESAIAGAHSDGVTLALRLRALPTVPARDGPAGALVFAAPPDVDVRALPRVEGGGAPALALAGRPPLGEPVTLDGARLADDVLLLAHADGEIPWGLPPGGRWTRQEEGLENLSRSRTLALGSHDLVATGLATARVEMGSGNATRTIVAIGGVTEGPTRALWTSAALVAGGVQPAAPRVIVPLEPGADREAVREAAIAAWTPLGLAYDR